MPQIDFYVISDSTSDAHLRHACRLAEEAVDAGQRVFIRVASPEDAKRIDDLLWTFGDGSFVPHDVVTPQSIMHPLVKVLIGDGVAPDNFNQVLINLSDTIPDDVAAMQRVVELVPQATELKRRARERYKHYRDSGLEPATQNV